MRDQIEVRKGGEVAICCLNLGVEEASGGDSSELLIYFDEITRPKASYGPQHEAGHYVCDKRCRGEGYDGGYEQAEKAEQVASGGVFDGKDKEDEHSSHCDQQYHGDAAGKSALFVEVALAVQQEPVGDPQAGYDDGDGNQITNNIIYLADDAVIIDSTCDRSVVTGNNFYGSTAGLTNNGTNTEIGHNIGVS